jgi:hypothetical protein
VSKVVTGKSKGKCPHEIHRCGQNNNIKMDFKVIVYESVNFVKLSEGVDRWGILVNTVRNLGVP